MSAYSMLICVYQIFFSVYLLLKHIINQWIIKLNTIFQNYWFLEFLPCIDSVCDRVLIGSVSSIILKFIHTWLKSKIACEQRAFLISQRLAMNLPVHIPQYSVYSNVDALWDWTARLVCWIERSKCSKSKTLGDRRK